MIATVHYKDIDFEEVLKCAPSTDTERNLAKWEEMRGKEVKIILPMASKEVTEAQYRTFTCGGPFYYRATGGRNDAICEHLIDWGRPPL